MDYQTPLERFSAPAAARPQVWRLLLGLLVLLLVYIGIVALLTFAVVLAIGDIDIEGLMSEDAMSEPWPLLWVLSTFIGMFFGPIVAVWLLHKRKAGTLFGRGSKVLRDFSVAAGTYLAIAGTLAIGAILIADTVPQLSFSRWIAFLPLAVLVILVQTLAEELVFRGYVLQQLHARFKSPIAWMVIPSLVFGALHFNPSLDAQTALIVVGITTFFGFIAADLTAKTGSIGAAWGFHFANNFVAICLISVDGTMTGLALYKTGFAAQDGLPASLILMDLFILGAGWFAMRRILLR